MTTAKEFLEDKQTKHYKRFGVYADTNTKIAEWVEEYAKLHVVNTIKKLSSTENEYQNNIKYVFKEYNIR